MFDRVDRAGPAPTRPMSVVQLQNGIGLMQSGGRRNTARGAFLPSISL